MKSTLCEPANRSDPIESVFCDPRTLQPCLNGAKSYEKWYQGGFLGVNNTFPAVVLANQTQVLTLRATAQDNNAGNLNLSQLLGIFTSERLAVRLYSQWLDRYFSNGPVPVTALFGTTNFPALFMGTAYVKAGTALKAETTDLSGSDNTATLFARGFRNLIQPGSEHAAQRDEIDHFDKYRKFLPYVLVPDLGPQVPAAGSTALAAGASLQITYTCPSDGDFYAVAPYFMVMSPVDGTVHASDFTIISLTESGASSSFIDPVILPIRADQFFTGQFNVTGWPDNILRPSGCPGGFGGMPYANGGQWSHRVHRGTQLQLTIKNNSAFSTRVCPLFVGYMATCDGAPGEFLAFPMNQGQESRTFSPVLAGDPGCATNCPPYNGQPLPGGGRVIVAPQGGGVPGSAAGMVRGGPPCPPPRYMAPSRQQLYRGGQGW